MELSIKSGTKRTTLPILEAAFQIFPETSGFVADWGEHFSVFLSEWNFLHNSKNLINSIKLYLETHSINIKIDGLKTV